MPQTRSSKLWTRAFQVLAIVWALFWVWFGAVSGAEEGWAGLLRNLPNAAPWALALAIALSALRWPKVCGAILAAIGLGLCVWVCVQFGHGLNLVFMLTTLALPPLLSGVGLVLASSRTSGVGSVGS